jgi:hypothetical protein
VALNAIGAAHGGDQVSDVVKEHRTTEKFEQMHTESLKQRKWEGGLQVLLTHATTSREQAMLTGQISRISNTYTERVEESVTASQRQAVLGSM